MEVNCTHCNNSTSADLKSDFIVFVCPQCQTVWEKDEIGELKKKETGRKTITYPTIAVGHSGMINGETYTVTGVMIKKAYGSYYWAEYILENSKGEFTFLSEADGHWIMLKEVPEQYDVDNHPRLLTHDSRAMNLFQYTNTQLYLAKGFFNTKIPKGDIHLVEYILPPHLISIEKYNGVETTFFGEHISSKAVSKAFPSYTMPLKSGAGMVQPFKFDVNIMAIIFCSAAILILLSHYFIYRDQTEQQVLSRDFFFAEFDGKDFTSQSFQLDGGSAPLTVRVHSEVDNSWANLQVALINEQSNEQIYASKDVEYYHGVTQGESWSEGSVGDTFNICGVKAGKYHLVLTPQKAPEDRANQLISVNVVWNRPSTRNAWFLIIGLALVCIGMYITKKQFEQKRWSDSSFSPYI
jgi:Zn-finger nucleic acid-binding protein